jgi:hypothetical protein
MNLVSRITSVWIFLMFYVPYTMGLQKILQVLATAFFNMPDIFYTLGRGKKKLIFFNFVIAFQSQFAISRDIVLLIIYSRYSDLVLYWHSSNLASIFNETQQTYINTLAYYAYATTNAFCRFCWVSARGRLDAMPTSRSFSFAILAYQMEIVSVTRFLEIGLCWLTDWLSWEECP